MMEAIIVTVWLSCASVVPDKPLVESPRVYFKVDHLVIPMDQETRIPERLYEVTKSLVPPVNCDIRYSAEWRKKP